MLHSKRLGTALCINYTKVKTAPNAIAPLQLRQGPISKVSQHVYSEVEKIQAKVLVKHTDLIKSEHVSTGYPLP